MLLEHRVNLNRVMNSLALYKSIEISPSSLVFAIHIHNKALPIGIQEDIENSKLYDAIDEEKWTGTINSKKSSIHIVKGKVVRTTYHNP